MHEISHRQFLAEIYLQPDRKVFFRYRSGAARYALLETIGRKSGKPRRTPVGDGLLGAQFWLVSEHATKSGYVRNIESDPRVRLKLRKGIRARWHNGTANLLSGDDPRERQRWLWRQMPSSLANAMAVRIFGTQLLTIRIDLDA